MKSRNYVFALLLAHMPLAAHSDAADVDDCRRMDDDTQRLACYDALFRAVPVREDAEPVVEVPPASEPLPPPRGKQTTVDEFGAENIEKAPFDRIEARLIGDFNGWNGNTIFRLDNGQIWKQTRNYIANYKPRKPIPQAKVTVSKGKFGSYQLRVEGVKRIVQVKRIK